MVQASRLHHNFNMNRARLLFILGFLVSLFAGVVVGMMVGHSIPATATPAATTKAWHRGMDMDAYLELSPPQKEQVRAIWSAVRPSPAGDGSHVDRRRAAAKERDEAILQLVPADRKPDYDRIQQEYTVAVAEMNKEHERLMQDAEVKMKAVLTEAQWKKFEEIKRAGLERGRNGRSGSMRGSTQPATHPSSRPPGGDDSDK